MYVYVAVALLAAFISGAGVFKVEEWRFRAMEADRLEQAREDKALREKSIDTAAVGHEKDKAEIRTEFVVITEKVNEALKSDFYAAGGPVCIDPAGLRELSAARRPAAPASVAAGAVPGPVPPHWWQPRGKPAPAD